MVDAGIRRLDRPVPAVRVRADVRGALGASPARLIRQFVTEGVLLVVIATALGITAAFGAMQLLMRLLSKDMLVRMPYLQGLSLNHRVFRWEK